MSKPKSINDIVEAIGGTEEGFKRPKPDKIKTRVKNNNMPYEDYNFMIDLLALPTTKNKNRYLVVCVDLETNEFDFEPIKSKKPDEILRAYKKMIKRPHINLSKGNMQMDGGGEFKGSFAKFLKDNKIIRRVTKAGRHSQNSVVENLNRTLGRLIFSYLNEQEIKTGKSFFNWDNERILNIIREKLNEYRYQKPRGLHYVESNIANEPKFNVDDIVYYALDKPLDALGKKQTTEKFRQGDRRYSITARKIKSVLPFQKQYRYILNGIDNVSFTENQLKRSKEKDETFEIREIIGKKKIKGRINYLVWWRGYPKSEATYEPRVELIKTARDLIKEFESKN